MESLKSRNEFKNDVYDCQCCFGTLGSEKESIEITEFIEQWYFDLTQLKLNNPNEKSQIICKPCFNDLKYCNEFRSELIEKQKNFIHQLEREHKENEIAKSFIKLEIPGEDPLEEELVLVKIESIDVNCNEELEALDTEDLLRSESHLDDLAECPECFELFHSKVISRHLTEKHLRSSTPKRYSCNQCPYTAAKPHRLENHCQKTHNSPAPNIERRKRPNTETKSRKQCPTCGIFVKNLSEHQKMVHVQVKRFCCDFCNYSCYFKTKITRHLQRHIPKHLREQFPCEIEDCSFFATRKDALKSHTLTMHQAREKTHLCNLCEPKSKKFFTRSQLHLHIKSVHEKLKNHLCNVCGKRFFNVKDMEMHVKRHGVKDMACEICGKLFYCSLDLRRHLKIHSDPTIKCDFPECSKRFYTKSKLNIHVKISHEGVKDYFCDYCSSRFSQYNNLKRHVNSVHKSLRINCLVPGCTYSVARKDKYKNHLASQHKFLDELTKQSILKTVKFE